MYCRIFWLGWFRKTSWDFWEAWLWLWCLALSVFEPLSRGRFPYCVQVSSSRLLGVSSHRISQGVELMEEGFLPPGMSLDCMVGTPLTPLEDCLGTGKAAVVAFVSLLRPCHLETLLSTDANCLKCSTFICFLLWNAFSRKIRRPKKMRYIFSKLIIDFQLLWPADFKQP